MKLLGFDLLTQKYPQISLYLYDICHLLYPQGDDERSDTTLNERTSKTISDVSTTNDRLYHILKML